MEEPQLKVLQRSLESEIATIRKEVGIIASRQEIVDFYKTIKEAGRKGKARVVRKADILTLATKYEEVVPLFTEMPEHTRLGFVPEVKRDSRGEGNIALTLLEKILYRDMCILSNLAIHKGSGSGKNLHVRTQEMVSTLQRTTINTAFSFLEAYINGVAEDHEYRNDRESDGKLRDQLEPYKMTQFQKRVQKYQIKILGVPQAILTMGNCKELKYIVKDCKPFRDAFTHPSSSWGKELRILVTSRYKMDESVDAAISLAKQLQEVFYGKNRPIPWLLDRNSDRLFTVQSGFDK